MRILVANEPRFLRECLAHALALEPQVDVAMECGNDDTVLRSAWRFRADFVFVTLDKPESTPRVCRTLLARCPEAHIIAVGRKTLVAFWLDGDIQACRMQYSLDAILDLIRRKQAYLESVEHSSLPRLPAPVEVTGDVAEKQTESALPHRQKQRAASGRGN